MNGRIILALIQKDIQIFFSNQFFALVTVLALVAYAAVYFAMPATVDETVEMAVFGASLPTPLTDSFAEAGVLLKNMETKAALETAVTDNEYAVGVVLPPDLLQSLAAGEASRIELYFSPQFPEELKDAYIVFFEEIGYNLGGQPLNIVTHQEILGVDRVGAQIPQRDKMLPLLAVLALAVETLGLASLISSEIEAGTLRALLITPVRMEGLFVAKGVVGVGLAFLQALILMAVTGGLSHQALLIIVALLLGSMMVTGIGFLLASVSTDIMSVMAWGVPTILLLSLPAIGLLLPGLITGWVKVLPTYYLIDTVYQAAVLNAGWAETGSNLLMLLAFTLVFMGLGIVVLRRKFR
ncbi:MAG: ABC transporter permease [Anaerolineae bacterium]|jgi:ABC-2 type transport system permease protein|nr:ABC transporter permease [Anaerolineae bacterium]